MIHMIKSVTAIDSPFEILVNLGGLKSTGKDPKACPFPQQCLSLCSTFGSTLIPSLLAGVIWNTGN